MGFWGVIIGGTIGSIVGGPVGAIIGAGIGGGLTNDVAQQENHSLMVCDLFRMLGKLAGIDSRVNKLEIEFLESVFVTIPFNVPTEDLKNAFREGRRSHLDFTELADIVAKNAITHEDKIMFLDFAVQLAASDVTERLSSAEYGALYYLERSLGLYEQVDRLVQQALEPPPDTIAVFNMLGTLGKIDGAITKEEIEVAENIIETFKKPNWRNGLIAAFNYGKNFNKSYELLLDELASLLTPEGANVAMAWFCAFVIADKPATEGEVNILYDIEDVLNLQGFTDNFLNEYTQGARGSYSSQGKQNSYGAYDNFSQGSLDECYKQLDCSPNASDAEVKAAWKKKLKNFHPDIISSKDLPEEFQEFAKKQAQFANDAYEKIRAHRGMK